VTDKLEDQTRPANKAVTKPGEKPLSPRAAAARAVRAVTMDKRSLDAALAEILPLVTPKDRGLAQELSYGTLRHHGHLFAIARALLWKPLEYQDRIVFCLLLVGLYQLEYTRIPDHAVMHPTVEAVHDLGRPRSGPLTNAVLRNWRRKREEVLRAIAADAGPDFRFAFPPWMLKRLRGDWPKHWENIVRYSNERPPLCMRVNRRQWTRDDCLSHFRKQNFDANPTAAEDGIVLGRRTVSKVREAIATGQMAVQDTSAQLAAALLAPKDGEEVLDACAAPGGKTGHILEMAPKAKVTAADLNLFRLFKVKQVLALRKSKAALYAADAAELGYWWPGKFDAVLLDSPCSGLGVLNRHPDIKHLRRESDIAEYAKLQQALLRSLWRLVAPGGRLVYVTCSILPEENNLQIKRFLRLVHDASIEDPGDDYGIDTGHGRQRLPGVHGGDGFFYALLRKTGGDGDGGGDGDNPGGTGGGA